MTGPAPNPLRVHRVPLPVQQAYARDQLENVPAGALAHALVALGVAGWLAADGAGPWPLLWVLAVWALLAWGIVLAQRGLAAIERDEDPLRHARTQTLRAALMACLWGTLFVLAYEPGGARQFVLLGVAAGISGFAAISVHFPVVVAAVLPSLPPLAFVVARAGAAHDLLIAAAILLYMAVMLRLSWISNTRLLKLELVSHEKDELVASLRAARLQAEQVADARRRFLAAASHDARQPVHAADLLLGSLLPRLDGDALRIARSIGAALESARSMFGTLLEFSRIEAGEERIVVADHAVRDLVEPLLDEFALAAEERGVSLESAATTLTVHSDADKLARILRNLISNAIRYCDGGRVLVGARRRGACVRIDVIDDGPGLTAADLDHAFREFDRVGVTAEAGFGLGLSVVQRTAELLGAPLEVDSVPGRGSRFSILLPRGTSPAEGSAPRAARVCCRGVDAELEAMLGRWGFETSAASTGADAAILGAGAASDDLPPSLPCLLLDAEEAGPHPSHAHRLPAGAGPARIRAFLLASCGPGAGR